ncbi:MAG: Bug family tripartite tricarboxylate transporter substrate binding protein [bacterium]|nr:tripartite tricarboxylate transporter substrate binding protein [Betaproteobacteria bacterium]
MPAPVLDRSTSLHAAIPATDTRSPASTLSHPSRRQLAAAGGAAFLLCAATPGLLYAQSPAAGNFPNRSIRLIVPFAPGGASDILGRALAQKMGEMLGQTVIVENRGGAAGTIGADVVVNASPDGYAILLTSLSTHAIALHIQRKVPYDTTTAFAGIGGIALSPNILTVGSNQPMRTVKEVTAAACANPGKVIFGSSGIGSIGHLASEILRASTGAEMTHVPFKSAAVAYPDVTAGNLTMVFDTLPSAMQHIKSGAVRPVVMFSASRAPAFPEVPTIGEAGFPGATLYFWSGLVAPAGTPPAVLQRLNEALNKSLAAADLRERLITVGADPWPTSPKQVETRARDDFERMGKLIRAAGIKGD